MKKLTVLQLALLKTKLITKIREVGHVRSVDRFCLAGFSVIVSEQIGLIVSNQFLMTELRPFPAF
ncbi:hypothetical protein ACVRZR_08175 [Streptococcus entericus]